MLESTLSPVRAAATWPPHAGRIGLERSSRLHREAAHSKGQVHSVTGVVSGQSRGSHDAPAGARIEVKRNGDR